MAAIDLYAAVRFGSCFIPREPFGLFRRQPCFARESTSAAHIALTADVLKNPAVGKKNCWPDAVPVVLVLIADVPKIRY